MLVIKHQVDFFNRCSWLACFQMCELFCVCCVACCDKWPQTWWLKNKRFILTVQAARYLKNQVVDRSALPLKPHGRTCYLPSCLFCFLVAASIPWLWAIALCLGLLSVSLLSPSATLLFFGGRWLLFNWNTALQCCVVFCHTTVWISRS